MLTLIFRALFVSAISFSTVSALDCNSEFKDPFHYHDEADAWVEKYVSDCPPEDLNMILNLIYLSGRRSANNLTVQKKMSLVSQAHNEASYLFGLARLNPTLYNKKHYPENLNELFSHFTDALSEHEKIGRAYNHAVDELVDGNVLIHKAGIILMRKNARIAVARALTTLADSLDNTIKSTQNTFVDSAQTLSSLNPLDISLIRKKGFVKNILKHITNLLTQSFANSDEAYTNAEYQSGKDLNATKESHNVLWEVMESVRIAFYQAYYVALYDHCINAGIQPRQLCLKIDQDGMHEDCLKNLPDPHSLSEPFALS